MSTKISALPPSAGLTLSDIFPVVDDPGGTPVTQRADFTQLATLLGTGNFVLKAGDTMTGVLVHPNGTAAAPSIAFAASADTGISRTGSGIGISVAGVTQAEFQTNGVSFRAGYIASFQFGIVSLSDNDGSISISMTAGPSISAITNIPGVFPEFRLDDGTDNVFWVSTSGAIRIGMASSTLGFFAFAPVVQQTAPTDSLAEVVAALRAYGLIG